MLLFMISCDAPDIGAKYRILLGELERSNPDLLDKQRLLVITKADLLASLAQADLPPTVGISSLTNKSIQRLKDMIWGALYEG